jgi:hypothetical protein
MTLTLLCLLFFQEPAKNDGWISLFNGKNYAGLNFYIGPGPEHTFDVKDGCMYIKAPLAGYTYTRQKYRNYELKFDWKFERPETLTDDKTFTGNSGVLLHINKILKSWPQSVEVEGRYLEVGKMMAYGKATVDFKDYPDARLAAKKPVGQWNSTHITSKDGALTVTLNGKLVSEGTTDLREGFIGFQAQGANILYRDIKLREIK